MRKAKLDLDRDTCIRVGGDTLLKLCHIRRSHVMAVGDGYLPEVKFLISLAIDMLYQEVVKREKQSETSA